MPMIHFVKGRPPVEVPVDAPLMDALLAAGLPVASSCRGDGICAKCRVVVVDGIAHLSPETELERRRRGEVRYPADQRLSCQARVRGDVTVDTSYW